MLQPQIRRKPLEPGPPSYAHSRTRTTSSNVFPTQPGYPMQQAPIPQHLAQPIQQHSRRSSSVNTISTSSSIPPPAAPEVNNFVATNYITNGNTVIEVYVTEVDVTVTATQTPAAVAGDWSRKRHLHRHMHHQHRLDSLRGNRSSRSHLIRYALCAGGCSSSLTERLPVVLCVCVSFSLSLSLSLSVALQLQ